MIVRIMLIGVPISLVLLYFGYLTLVTFRYPPPGCNNTNPAGFILTDEERFKNPVAFNKKQLALYFTTQSDIIAAVERKQTTYKQAENWLDADLALFFGNNDAAQTLMFGNWIKFLQRVS